MNLRDVCLFHNASATSKYFPQIYTKGREGRGREGTQVYSSQRRFERVGSKTRAIPAFVNSVNSFLCWSVASIWFINIVRHIQEASPESCASSQCQCYNAGYLKMLKEGSQSFLTHVQLNNQPFTREAVRLVLRPAQPINTELSLHGI